jgi:phage terminase large subunit-like protein
VKPLPSIKNKAIKLASFQARAAQGKVHLPLKRLWATRLVDQLCDFPGGKYDDAADVCGLLGRGVDDMMAAHDDITSPRKVGIRPFSVEWLESTDEQPIMPRYA